MIPWLDPHDPDQPFPPLEEAAIYPDGLLCAGGDLSTPRLLSAYRSGIFPWYSEGEPILWWSPDPRLIIEPERLHVSRRLQRTLQGGAFRLSLDREFEAVMRGCAAPRPGQPTTWITEDMIQAYVRLHQEGHAHSLEVWDDDALVGGIYGIAIGRAFFGESKFHTARDASKVALAALCALLAHHEFGLLDCQVESPHLRRMGAVAIPRAEFRQRIDTLCALDGPRGDWNSLSRPVQLAPVFRHPA